MSEGLEAIIEYAKAREQASADFYRRWAERVTDAEVSRLLAELAAEEDEHLDRLSSTPVAEWLATPPARPDYRLSDDMEMVEPSEGLTLLETLQMAITREASSIALYDRLRKSGGEAARLFSSLMEEERRHKHTLEERYARRKRGLDERG